MIFKYLVRSFVTYYKIKTDNNDIYNKYIRNFQTSLILFIKYSERDMYLNIHINNIPAISLSRTSDLCLERKCIKCFKTIDTVTHYQLHL